MKISIVKEVDDDIVAHEKHIWDYRYALNRDDFEVYVSNPDKYLFYKATTNDNALTGIIVCELKHNEGGHIQGYIVTLSVYEQFRRQGLSTALLDAIVVHARQEGVHVLTLHTFKFRNKSVIDFYHKKGFATIKTLCRYYGTRDALLMKRSI